MERQAEWKRKSIAAYEAGPAANVRWLVEHVPEGLAHGAQPLPDLEARAAARPPHLPVLLHRLPRAIGTAWARPTAPLPAPLNFTLLQGREISGGILYYRS